jgi:hypothetical protein
LFDTSAATVAVLTMARRIVISAVVSLAPSMTTDSRMSAFGR